MPRPQLRLWISDWKRRRIAKSPQLNRYRPELDVLEILGPDAANWFQNIIGILNWILELGRVNTNILVAKLFTFLAKPKARNLRAALHMFSYLKH